MANDSAPVDSPLDGSAVDASAPDASALCRDFFISRAGADKDVALAIAGILRAAGLTTWLQHEDFGHASFMARMAQGWSGSKGMICVLSQAYQKTEHCKKEYEVALHDDPRNLNGRVIVLRVEDCAPIEHLADLAYTDLLPVLHDAEALAQVVRGAVAPDRDRGEADLAAVHRRLPQRVLHDKVHRVAGFAGRGEELDKLEKALWAEGGGAAAVVAAQGLGGVGKSVLAREYAWRNRARYQGVWWVHAGETLLGDLGELGAQFISGLKDMPERDKAARLALNWLEQGEWEKPWLLVYDNVEEPAQLKGLTPRAGAHVLITTRWSDWGKTAAPVEVGVFPPDVATQFLLDATGRADRVGAKDLVAALGHLPLALDHAAAYCRRTGTGFADYQRLAADLLQAVPEGVNYERPVLATFSLAIAGAAEACPKAEMLLGLCAFLAPDRIPLALFTADVLSEIDRGQAVAALTEVSLVSLDPMDDGSPGLRVHRLVQAAMRGRLAEMGEHDNAAALATELVADAYPSGDPGPDDARTWPACARLTPHALAVLEHARDSGSGADKTALLLNQTALNSVSRSAYADAEPLYRRALGIDEASLGRDHPAVARDLNNLAGLLQTTNRLAEAEPLIRRVVAIFETFERDTGHRHPHYEGALANLAALEAEMQGDGAAPEGDVGPFGSDIMAPAADAAMMSDAECLTPPRPVPKATFLNWMFGRL